MTCEIVTRSQHSWGSRSGFGGPDHYMVVVVKPDGTPQGRVANMPLSTVNLQRRSWKMRYCGEYYGEHTGPRSAYARAQRRAREIMDYELAKALEPYPMYGRYEQPQEVQS